MYTYSNSISNSPLSDSSQYDVSITSPYSANLNNYHSNQAYYGYTDQYQSYYYYSPYTNYSSRDVNSGQHYQLNQTDSSNLSTSPYAYSYYPVYDQKKISSSNQNFFTSKSPNYNSFASLTSNNSQLSNENSTIQFNASEVIVIHPFPSDSSANQPSIKTSTKIIAHPRNILADLVDDQTGDQTKQSSNSRKRRARTAFTPDQRRYLLTVFEKTIYPTREVLEAISAKLNVSTSVLQIWFKNTRSKQKKLTNTKHLH